MQLKSSKIITFFKLWVGNRHITYFMYVGIFRVDFKLSKFKDFEETISK